MNQHKPITVRNFCVYISQEKADKSEREIKIAGLLFIARLELAIVLCQLQTTFTFRVDFQKGVLTSYIYTADIQASCHSQIVYDTMNIIQERYTNFRTP